MMIVCTQDEVVGLEVLAEQQRHLRGHAADRGDAVLDDAGERVGGPPPAEHVGGRAEAQVPGQLRHEPDVGELRAGQHRGGVGGRVAPGVGDVDAGDRGQLPLAEPRALGQARGAGGEHQRDVALGVVGRRRRRGCPGGASASSWSRVVRGRARGRRPRRRACLLVLGQPRVHPGGDGADLGGGGVGDHVAAVRRQPEEDHVARAPPRRPAARRPPRRSAGRGRRRRARLPSGSTNAGRSPKRARRRPDGGGEGHRTVFGARCAGPELNTVWPSASASSLMARLRNVLPTSMAWPRDTSRAVQSVRRRGLHRGGRLRRDRRRDAVGGGLQLARRGDLGDQADLEGPGGADALVVAHQGHPQHLAERHAVQHLDRLEHGRHPVGDVRVEERGVLGGDDDVDLAEQVEGAAAGHAVHGGHHRLPALVGPGPEAAAGVDVGERVERVLDAALVGRAPRRGRCRCRRPSRRRR